MDGTEVQRDVTKIRWSIEAAEKGGFPHFTLKEIYEQPHAIQEALRGRVDGSGEVSLPELDAIKDKLLAADRVYVIGCGTARYAGEVGAHLIQQWAGLPASSQIGSEMRYSPPPLDARTLVISVSQSGETADTLAPQKLAAEAGATIVVVTNVVGSAITREADAICYLQAGPEVAVASTKAFVTQVVVLQLIALHLARLRGRLSEHQVRTFGIGLRELPGQAAEALKLAPQIKKLARRWTNVRDVMFIGRALGFPIAMEGALKLKELSYVHAEGYAAGELKHGPIALLDPDTPLVAVATSSATYEKVVSNVAEVRAREAPVVAVATAGDEEIGRYAQDVLYVPATLEELAPAIAIIPLQLLAYEVAVARGTDVDQPRNLAKSVTVE
jgi:glucosamine--fructose-6-phosphate aminotransferase (isomerizing)